MTTTHFYLLADATSTIAGSSSSVTLFSVGLVEGKIEIEFNYWLICAVVVVATLVIAWLRRSGINAEVDEVTLKFGDVFEQKIKLNRDTQRIAFATYAELITRKVALPLDEDHDVITEVYDSWYQVFGVVRELLKQVPAHHLANSEPTQKLADVLIKLLNQGLRPHLTKWQARYRRWYRQVESQEASKAKTPQELQRLYPDYLALMADLKCVNSMFVEFCSELRVLAVGTRPKPRS